MQTFTLQTTRECRLLDSLLPREESWAVGQTASIPDRSPSVPGAPYPRWLFSEQQPLGVLIDSEDLLPSLDPAQDWYASPAQIGDASMDPVKPAAKRPTLKLPAKDAA